MSDLSSMECVPCRGGVPPLEGEALLDLHRRLGEDWEVVAGHHLQRTYPFPDFAQALAFTNRVGEMAENQNHHPDLHLAWGKVQVVVWTHKVDGLTESDFVFAAKADELAAPTG